MSIKIADGTLARESKMVRANADFLRYVGALDGAWRWADAADCHHAELRKFRQSAVVEVDHRERDRDGNLIEEYRLTDAARAYLREYLDQRETLCPCDHAGINNHGDHYACGFGPCDETFARSEVEA